MSRYARSERNALADALVEAGADAPTLCTGWTGYDLAAHVVMRERRPDAAPGLVVKALAGRTEQVRRQYRDGHGFADLVSMIRHPPRWNPMVLPPFDEFSNTAEFFVHTEDTRRAQPGWQPRPLDPGLAAALWPRARSIGRLGLRSFPAAVHVSAPGHGEFLAGSADGERVEVTGDPGELLLFFFGRQRASRAVVGGHQALAARLREARLGG